MTTTIVPEVMTRQATVAEASQVAGRFWSKVDKNGPPWNGTPCWIWIGAKSRKGYGTFKANDGRTRSSHRVAYESLVGLIPDGLQTDHLCRNRACVNPTHLEMVTTQVNVLRGVGLPAQRARTTHCPQGHPYDLTNTYTDSRNSRHCRICLKIRNAARTRPIRRGGYEP